MSSSQAGERHWLSWTRIKHYAQITLYLNILIGSSAMFYWWMTSETRPLFITSDLAVFWIAGGLASSGHGILAYDPEQIRKILELHAPLIQGRYGWFYPPTFLLIVVPMGYVSYGAAYLGFMVASVMGYWQIMKRLLPMRSALWCVAAFPGIWINLLTGQNGLLTGAIASAALFFLPKRQMLAGALIGLLAIKPHLAMLFPLALLAVGAWEALVVAAMTVGIFAMLSGMVLGFDTWSYWQHSLGLARAIMEGGGTAVMMPTAFSFLRMLHAPLAVAYAGQFLVAAGAAAAVWIVWRTKVVFPVKAAALMTASLLATPYLFEYDLAWLGPVLAWIAPVAYRNARYRYERELLLAAWWLPIATILIARMIHVQIGPWFLGALLWMIVRHAQEPETP
ncbi:MAG: DUF2029 domain-containing protein [Betaproteobacteria bacterium]|nr:DUF2029 domain-containing protein [Betaproteobacteria bacterium]